MDISPVNRSVPAPAQSVSVDPVDRSGQNRDVVQAVKAVNSAEMFGDNELEFQRDPQTHRMLIRVVNRKTKELISQIPPDYVLRLAENLKTPKP
ncbi:MAG TPA: flagellar protein FlaG [Verrucomicrobiae bacterium]|nr:flagellar protein FlaG [Verrucomicrobiae bacterium]